MIRNSRIILSALFLAVLFTTHLLAQELPDEEYFPITVERKSGFIDRQGKVLIPPEFDAVSKFSNGLAKVHVRGKYNIGYIDKSGKFVIEPKFDIGGDFKEGFAMVGFDREKIEYKIGNRTFYGSGQGSHSFNYDIGFIDKTGKFIAVAEFAWASDFSEGLALVETKDEKYGYIDLKGQMAIAPTFEWADDFSEGLAVVLVDGKYGFIDQTGKFVVGAQFTDAKRFSEGLACVKIGGRFRAPPIGTQFIETSKEDMNFAFIDRSGKIVFKIESSDLFSFSEGLARFEALGGVFGYVNRSGEMVIKPSFWGASDYSDGLAKVILEGGISGWIDQTGKVVLRTSFKGAGDFQNGLAKVYDSYSWDTGEGYIDRSGKIVWTPTK